MHDLVIRGAQVFDGLGNPPVVGDVAIDAGRIRSIGHVAGAGRATVDAGGLALMPGIIDLHTHYDAQITWKKLKNDKIIFNPCSSCYRYIFCILWSFS